MSRFLAKKGAHRHQAAYEGVLGTSLEISILSGSEADGLEAERRVLMEIDRLEDIFSVYRNESEFNRWQETRGVAAPVSRDLAIVLNEAEHWRALSSGAFLPVVEALTRAWRRREAGQIDFELPSLDPEEPMWTVDLEASTATRLTHHPASLNAIAKGYIVDSAAFAAGGVLTTQSVMINIGGDLVHRGAAGVQVAVTDPARPAENAEPLCYVRLSNAAVATSAGYRRGFRLESGWYSHIFDPSKSEPVQLLRNASIIAQSAMSADILATILGVLPPEEGIAFADRFDSVGAMVVDSAGNCLQNRYWAAHRVDLSPMKPQNVKTL